MAESIVTDWLTDYAAIEPSEIRTFAAQHENNHEISMSLFTILNERLKYPDLLHSICNQLYSFYRSNENELRRFTLQFVPTLIYIYLNSVAQGDKKSCRCIETLLISVYNIEVRTDDGQPKIVTFRMPIIAQASVYHEEKSLHPSDLRRWEEYSNKDVNWGPLPQIETINAQNRLKVMTALLFAYNQQLSLIQKSALYHLCRVASQIVNQGFSKLGHAHRSSYGNDPNNSIVSKPLVRIPVSSQFLLELLHATYFAMFNEFASFAIQTVDDIHNRACYELYSEVILVTNAVKNSLHANPSGQPCDGPMGISVALTPATTTVTVSKSMITNASFRTKKLPDDIPIQGPKDDGGSAQLLSITEDYENESQIGNRNTTTRSSKDNNPKIHRVFKKSKDKDKDGKNAINKNNAVPVNNNNNNNATTNDKDSKDNNKETILSKSLLNKKDKISIKNQSLQQSVVDSVTDGLDKISPIPLMKRKSSNIDIVNGSITTNMLPMQNLSNGDGVLLGDDKLLTDSYNNSADLSDSIDTSSDLSGAQQQRPSIDIKSHNVQVS